LKTLNKYLPQILIVIGLTFTTLGGFLANQTIKNKITKVRDHQTGKDARVKVSFQVQSLVDRINKVEKENGKLKIYIEVIGEIPAYDVLTIVKQSGRAGLYSPELFAFEIKEIRPNKKVEIGEIIFPNNEINKCFYDIRAYNKDVLTLTELTVAKDNLDFFIKQKVYSDLKKTKLLESYVDENYPKDLK